MLRGDFTGLRRWPKMLQVFLQRLQIWCSSNCLVRSKNSGERLCPLVDTLSFRFQTLGNNSNQSRLPPRRRIHVWSSVVVWQPVDAPSFDLLLHSPAVARVSLEITTPTWSFHRFQRLMAIAANTNDVMSADVLHPGFHHATSACYLYLGRCSQLYRAFIFVSFLSVAPVNLHKWEAHLYGAHPTGDEAPWKSFPSNQPLQSFSSREQHGGKCLFFSSLLYFWG